jgi:hypothetical protein
VVSTTTWETKAAPGSVWAVLADGWLYPCWVVGASRMRDVERGWPAEGTRLHHSVGAWPVLIDDTTSSVACDPPRLLTLQARAWPAGEARVEITIEPTTTGSRVTIREDAVAGPGTLLPGAVRQPLLDARNREALRRLALIAEGRERLH